LPRPLGARRGSLVRQYVFIGARRGRLVRRLAPRYDVDGFFRGTIEAASYAPVVMLMALLDPEFQVFAHGNFQPATSCADVKGFL